jgi:hypothetical protein
MKRIERDHARNANFVKVVIGMEYIGEEYNPFMLHLQLPKHKKSFSRGQKEIQGLNSNEHLRERAIEERNNIVIPLGKLLIRTHNVYMATTTAIKPAQSLAYKIQSKHQGTAKKVVVKVNVEEKKKISASTSAITSTISYNKIINL